MKGNKIRVFTLLVVLSVVFSLLFSSAACYAEIEKRYKDKAASQEQEDSQDRPAYKAGELLIKFKDGTSSHGMSAFSTENGLNEIKSFDSLNIGLYSVKGGKSANKAIRALEDNDEIEYIQPNYLYYPTLVPNDYYFDLLDGLDYIDAPEAWDITQGNCVVVAVIDTGIDHNHPELSGRMWVNPGEIAGNGADDDGNRYIDDIYGWDFYSDDNSVFDDEYDDEHGTHVAGIIAAEENDDGVIGVAPEAKIMSLKFIGPDDGTTADAIEAIEYAREMGVKVVNCSWGGNSDDPALKQAIEDSDMLFVVAAGNNGRNIDVSPVYPAAYDSSNILTVANVSNGERLDPSSNYGAVSVDVGAPGRRILSTVSGA
ncbi:MAG TPA: S8 family peptidase, partial [Bacillota bacterium]|nr:S8 family peptidase [Bacillota bacterium]